ncbi:diaminopimelate epimerase [Cognatiyoonia sp. IB215446]|uniref:diaminopimelate epimerase n=1 Tax=Cognatiyoonia sp. IB215446 TaxID=3097355 RepID=UPI002A12E8A8|nr:diaminopimelate epimerase [Cognatiyoonia sp. IB215446]MDX8350531.1 diaminopimelate epimerase [Cognatiyoonia sp. IB215446]
MSYTIVYMPAMAGSEATYLPFMKMHGLGNDFVVVDARQAAAPVDSHLAQAMGDRHTGIGFDQLAVMTETDKADIHLTFWNSDGSQAAACGNATRCIARYLMDETGRDALTITTERGTLQAVDADDGLISVNMGQPLLTWDQVPLAHEMETLSLPIEGAPTATGMGNPHCTFFVDDAEAIDLQMRGAEIEHHPLFPERTNVQFASVIGPDHLRMRVWERGVGITLASGSSSCATAVAAVRRGLTGRDVTIDLDGGRIQISWRDDGVWMTGPTAHVFDGQWRLT